MWWNSQKRSSCFLHCMGSPRYSKDADGDRLSTWVCGVFESTFSIWSSFCDLMWVWNWNHHKTLSRETHLFEWSFSRCQRSNAFQKLLVNWHDSPPYVWTNYKLLTTGVDRSFPYFPQRHSSTQICISFGKNVILLAFFAGPYGLLKVANQFYQNIKIYLQGMASTCVHCPLRLWLLGQNCSFALCCSLKCRFGSIRHDSGVPGPPDCQGVSASSPGLPMKSRNFQ